MSLVVTSKAFRYRVYPTASQIERFGRWESALRFLWNLANEQRLMGLARPHDERVFPTAFDQINELTELRSRASVACRRSSQRLLSTPRRVGQGLATLLQEAR